MLTKGSVTTSLHGHFRVLVAYGVQGDYIWKETGNAGRMTERFSVNDVYDIKF